MHAPECTFDPSCFPIASNKQGPFDSQNTFLRADLLRDYFMFPHVGRMDGIWPGYYSLGLSALPPAFRVQIDPDGGCRSVMPFLLRANAIAYL
jgi:hypothetical protein